MELSNDGTPLAWKSFCEQCRNDNGVGSRFCETCGAPLDDWEFELLHAPSLHKARKWMGVVAFLYLGGGLLTAAFAFSADANTAVSLGVFSIAIGGTQAGLWWWARRATFPAAVASLALYVLINLLEAVNDPMSLGRGWLIKILFISALWKAIQAGLAVRKLQAEAALARK